MHLSIFLISIIVMMIAIIGIFKPYYGWPRKAFGIATIFCFILSIIMLVTVPKPTPEELAAREADKAVLLAQKAKRTSQKIASKADLARNMSISYERSSHSDTYKTIGASAFARLNELEEGALFAVSEAKMCDKIEIGAVSLTKSSRDNPVWFVDCKNGNRFLVSSKQAEEALDRYASDSLNVTSIQPDCTTRSLALCDASKAQRAANESEVLTMCDLMLELASTTDVSTDWGYDYAFSDGDKVQIVRGFKVKNAFGVKLKHRYMCYFDAGIGQIVEMKIEGPSGIKRII